MSYFKSMFQMAFYHSGDPSGGGGGLSFERVGMPIRKLEFDL